VIFYFNSCDNCDSDQYECVNICLKYETDVTPYHGYDPCVNQQEQVVCKLECAHSMRNRYVDHSERNGIEAAAKRPTVGCFEY
jgi:hypothetical protein